jgi:methionyl-tRNA formyltransferase
MDEEMDTGHILLSTEIRIEEDTAASLHDRLMEAGAALVIDTLEQLADNRLTPRPQNHQEATYTRLLVKEDGRIDWQEDAWFISRQVRAMNPWPAAFSHLSGEPIKIWKAAPVSGDGPPGEIVGIDPKGVTVGTGNGLIVLEELQAPGKGRLAAADFVRGRRMKIRDRFDG